MTRAVRGALGPPRPPAAPTRTRAAWLTSGWATLGYNAATIAGDQRGVSWLLAEDGQPVRLRSYCLADADLQRVAARATHLRAHRKAPPR